MPGLPHGKGLALLLASGPKGGHPMPGEEDEHDQDGAAPGHMEQVADEMFQALEAKDHTAFVHAFKAMCDLHAEGEAPAEETPPPEDTPPPAE